MPLDAHEPGMLSSQKLGNATIAHKEAVFPVSFITAITLSWAFLLPAGHSITCPACQLHACP